MGIWSDFYLFVDGLVSEREHRRGVHGKRHGGEKMASEEKRDIISTQDEVSHVRHCKAGWGDDNDLHS